MHMESIRKTTTFDLPSAVERQDTLTAVLSRNAFLDEVVRQCDGNRGMQNKLLALAVVRVGMVKEINRSLGYGAGDSTLVEVAHRLRSALRPQDIIGRLGGSAFAVLLPGLGSRGQAILAANKFLKVCDNPLMFGEQRVKLRVFVGIGIFPENARTHESLLQSAEAAAANAAQRGSGYEILTNDFIVNESPILALEGELEEAIKKGTLDLYYQPKVDIGRGIIAGVETLARWTSPTRGPVRPDIFIDVAEKTGLIGPLTQLTLNIAFRHAAAFSGHSGHLSVALNLSPAVLDNCDIEEMAKNAMEIWGVPKNQLMLEVTESAMMNDPEKCLATLHNLNMAGLRISIDDFGTGYSSLAYLKKLPVSELKIDKSFVMNMVSDKGDAQIVRSVIDLAHNFELSVVAEGVENQETLDVLKTLGCEYAQGFYLGKPMPADALARWIAESPWGIH